VLSVEQVKTISSVCPFGPSRSSNHIQRSLLVIAFSVQDLTFDLERIELFVKNVHGRSLLRCLLCSLVFPCAPWHSLLHSSCSTAAFGHAPLYRALSHFPGTCGFWLLDSYPAIVYFFFVRSFCGMLPHAFIPNVPSPNRLPRLGQPMRCLWQSTSSFA
jgi:hypothetical protein